MSSDFSLGAETRDNMVDVPFVPVVPCHAGLEQSLYVFLCLARGISQRGKGRGFFLKSLRPHKGSEVIAYAPRYSGDCSFFWRIDAQTSATPRHSCP